ncbi:hypothetical protein D3C71_1679180 [compost metagenome]
MEGCIASADGATARARWLLEVSEPSGAIAKTSNPGVADELAIRYWPSGVATIVSGRKVVPIGVVGVVMLPRTSRVAVRMLNTSLPTKRNRPRGSRNRLVGVPP